MHATRGTGVHELLDLAHELPPAPVLCKGTRTRARLRLPMRRHVHPCPHLLQAECACSASPSMPTGHPLLHAGRALSWSPAGSTPLSAGSTGLQCQKMHWRQMQLVSQTRPRQLSLPRLGHMVDGCKDKGRQRLNGGKGGPCATPYTSSYQLKKPLVWVILISIQSLRPGCPSRYGSTSSAREPPRAVALAVSARP